MTDEFLKACSRCGSTAPGSEGYGTHSCVATSYDANPFFYRDENRNASYIHLRQELAIDAELVRRALAEWGPR